MDKWINSNLCLENLKSNLMGWCFWFVKFLKFLNSSTDLVHIMKPMNRKKRIDLSLIRGLRIENFDINMLAYAGAQILPMARSFIHK